MDVVNTEEIENPILNVAASGQFSCEVAGVQLFPVPLEIRNRAAIEIARRDKACGRKQCSQGELIRHGLSLLQESAPLAIRLPFDALKQSRPS